MLGVIVGEGSRLGLGVIVAVMEDGTMEDKLDEGKGDEEDAEVIGRADVDDPIEEAVDLEEAGTDSVVGCFEVELDSCVEVVFVDEACVVDPGTMIVIWKVSF